MANLSLEEEFEAYQHRISSNPAAKIVNIEYDSYIERIHLAHPLSFEAFISKNGQFLGWVSKLNFH